MSNFYITLWFFTFFSGCQGAYFYEKKELNSIKSSFLHSQKINLNTKEYYIQWFWLNSQASKNQSSEKNEFETLSFSGLQVGRKQNLVVAVKSLNQEWVSLPTNYEFEFYAWMPSMGHPLKNSAVFTGGDSGLYLNTGIEFNMSGLWEMQILIWDENSNLIKKIIWNESIP